MLSFYKNAVPILLFSGVLAGCTSTGDIQKLAPNVFQVSTAACPACGGTSKSMELALQKANLYCADKNKDIVVDNYENESLNLAGAGATSLEFRCIDEVDSTSPGVAETCFDDLYQSITATYDPEALKFMRPNLATSEDVFYGFSALSNAAFATIGEKGILMTLGAGMAVCEDLHGSSLADAHREIWALFSKKRLAIFADLSMGSITYSDHAKRYNGIVEQELSLAMEQTNRQEDIAIYESNARSARRIMMYDAVIN